MKPYAIFLALFIAVLEIQQKDGAVIKEGKDNYIATLGSVKQPTTA